MTLVRVLVTASSVKCSGFKKHTQSRGF